MAGESVWFVIGAVIGIGLLLGLVGAAFWLLVAAVRWLLTTQPPAGEREGES